MRGRLALLAEVLGGGHDARAEIGLPDAVDDRSRGRRRLAIDQPARQRQAIDRRALG